MRLGRAAALIIVAVGCAVSAQASATAGNGEATGAVEGTATKVKVITSGNRSERVKVLPITDKPWERPRVVMSLKKKLIPELQAGDKLRTSVEAQFTNSCTFRVPRCVGPPYRYSPRIDARLELSAGNGATPSKRTVLATGREICGNDEPHREHHCVLVMRPTQRTLKRGKPRCGPDRCNLKLVASAHHKKADQGDRIPVGGNQPDGSIPQDRGRINLTHIRPGRDPIVFRRHRRKKLRVDSVATDLKRRSVLSVPLKRLDAGDQLEVEAAVRNTISHLPYTVRTTAHLVFASSPSAVEPDAHARRVGIFAGEIGESNGYNCPLPRGSCRTRKVGVMKLRADPKRTMYANLVLLLGPKRAEARSGDAGRLSKGKLKIRRYPAR